MDRTRRYRLIGGFVLFGLALILLLSVASHHPQDLASTGYPPNRPVENLLGTAGAYIDYGGRFLVGTGCYLVALILAVAGALLMAGRPIDDLWVRLAGCLIIVVSWSAGVALIFEGGIHPGGFGGMLGRLLAENLLRPYLGTTGAYLAVLLAFAAGSLLAADVLVLWLGRRGVALLTAEGRAPAVGGNSDRSATTMTADRLAEQKAMLRERLKELGSQNGEAKVSAPPAPDRKPPLTDAPTLIVRERKPSRGRGRAKSSGGASGYQLPGVELLDPLPLETQRPEEHIEVKREVLERTLEEFRIAAQVVEIDRGPVITQFELEIAPGVKITQIAALADDLARALKAPSVRVVAPIPGKSTVGVEVPNAHREIVRFRELFESGVLERKRMNIPLLLGKDASGTPLVADLAQMPHLLIAGATGSGKSVCINSIIMSFLMTQYPDELKLILMDPKMVELAAFRDVPHLMTPVVTDMKKAAGVLEWACRKMDERYSLLANVGARNIAAYNALGEDGIRRRLDVRKDEPLEGVPFHMHYIVIIIDELADLMMVAAKDVENLITRLAQKSRAVGLHLIVATQRPSVDVVTGLIKANLPSRIAFQTASKVDSRTIIDRNGAEKLLGRGDMLFLPPGSSALIRMQGSFVSDDEIRRVTACLAEQAKPRFEQELLQPTDADEVAPAERDELFDEAVRIILESQRGSVSLLQRRLGIGYSRAARLIDIMAELGIVGDYKGSQAREVLWTLEDWEAARQGQSTG